MPTQDRTSTYAVIKDLARLEADAAHGGYMRAAMEYRKARLVFAKRYADEMPLLVEAGRNEALIYINANRATYCMTPLASLEDN